MDIPIIETVNIFAMTVGVIDLETWKWNNSDVRWRHSGNIFANQSAKSHTKNWQACVDQSSNWYSEIPRFVMHWSTFL